jgi:hypothetical protein
MSKYLSQLKTYPYSDVLGWSYSRYDTFTQCKRKYYYEYYRKQEPWADRPKIERLRNLTSVPLEIGVVAHKILQVLLRRLQKTFEPIDERKMLDYALRQTQITCGNKEFEDVYYKVINVIDPETDVFPGLSEALLNFLHSHRMQWVLEEALVSKDDWIVEMSPEHQYGECRIDGMKAYCKVDFMFPVEDEVHILDWKTGKEAYVKHRTQLNGYAGWANCQFGISFDRIKTTVAYLRPSYVEKSMQVNEYDIDDFSATVKSQSHEMYEYCSDPGLNVPKIKDAFAMTPVENFCKTCKYREICDRV